MTFYSLSKLSFVYASHHFPVTKPYLDNPWKKSYFISPFISLFPTTQLLTEAWLELLDWLPVSFHHQSRRQQGPKELYRVVSRTWPCYFFTSFFTTFREKRLKNSVSPWRQYTSLTKALVKEREERKKADDIVMDMYSLISMCFWRYINFIYLFFRNCPWNRFSHRPRRFLLRGHF